MTNVDRRMFDELARCLRSNKVGNALILQVADVCARANRNFRRDWFLEAAGYVSITPRVKLLKLGNKTKVVAAVHADPTTIAGDDPYPADNHVDMHGDGWAGISGVINQPGKGKSMRFDEDGKEENK